MMTWLTRVVLLRRYMRWVCWIRRAELSSKFDGSPFCLGNATCMGKNQCPGVCFSSSLEPFPPPAPPLLPPPGACFCVQTKAEVDKLCTLPALSRLGAEALHGGLSQAAREACLGRFRSGRTKVCVCV